MPSTGKTPTLGLNKWELTDKPKMNDFNKDNENIENFAAEHKQKMTEVEKKSKSNEDRLDALRVGTINRLEWYNSESYTGPGNITSITDAPTKRRGFKWSGMSTGPQTLEIKTLPIEPNSDYVLAFLEDIEGSFNSYEIKLAYTNGGQQYKSIVKQGSTSQSNGYKLKTHKFSIPSGATDTKIQFVVQGATSSTSLKVLNLLLARGNVVPDYNLAPEDVLRRLDLLFEKGTNLQAQINQKAAQGDVLLKVNVPLDRDCNNFKQVNAFFSFDTGSGDFKNTPDGTLAQGSSRVFTVRNYGYSEGRFQQEFINLYPANKITRYIRNYIYESNSWSKWYKVYDEANKPTPKELGAYPTPKNAITDFNLALTEGQYLISGELPNAPISGVRYGILIIYVSDQDKHNNSNNWIWQEYYDTSGNSYWRYKVNDRDWFPWRKNYNSEAKPTPEEIGAWTQSPPRLVTPDFNTLTKGGTYATVSNSVDKNAPVTGDGRLMVIPWSSMSFCSQVFFHDTNRLFIRVAQNNEGTEWTPWTEIYSKKEKPRPSDIGALPTIGGEMNGNINFMGGTTPLNIITQPNWGGWARGLYFSDSQRRTLATLGAYGSNGTDVECLFMSFGDDGYTGNKGLKVTKTDITFNNQKLYHVGNKPTPSDIGAVSKRGDKITGTMRFEANANEIEIVNPSQGLQARGMVFKNDYTNNNIIGMIGAYLNGTEMVKAFLGTTATPWDGVNSLTVDKNGVYFNNQKLYYAGNKPTPSDIGAASSSHNHDSTYLGKTATAANSNKLKEWDLAGDSNDYAGIPFISHDGVMELGPILDFHLKGSKKDFDMRITTRDGSLEVDKALSAENLWARKYLRINDWYGGAEDGRLWFKQENKKLYTENVTDFVVNDRSIAKGDYWDNDNGNVRVCHLGGGLRLVRQIVKTGYANSGGGVSYTIHFPKAWNWVLPISLVSHNYNDASNNTSGYCTIDHWTNSYLNGGCYQMVAGKPTQIILTYLATE